MLTVTTVLAESLIPPFVFTKQGFTPSYTSESLPVLQLFVPLMMAPGALLLSVWLLPKVNALLKPEILKMALLATVMLGVLAMEPLPLNASVPPLTVVAPV
jgi:hypothetical protein